MTKQITQNLFNIQDNTAHVWSLFLPNFIEEIADLSRLLSQDEQDRANRFHFPIHQQRFTLTRGLLRKTLQLYTGLDPEKITFHYGEHGKPSLMNNHLDIRFNVSHSHDMAVFALIVGKDIGVDIEKTEPSFKESVAKRFFSPNEFTELMELSDIERISAFYKIWSRKEALIKVLGNGLFTPLDSFSVSAKNDSQIVTMQANDYLVQQLTMHTDYQAAFATLPPVKKILIWKWVDKWKFENIHETNL